ncbi:GTP cyclohydrolase I [Mycobacterium sp.]|uniref:GTP cyclohydrolase I n=1 Tax=Mycobacterium sp. TaxID=1785 RepID=UPI002CEF1A49|nr:GTP cyclohydrolase I [Mycobacterium sp.]HTQ19252.1 GTP cyclohydrolase I [Mycobacterium sp.]
MLRHADLPLLAGGPAPASDHDSELVLAGSIPFQSLCEQHLLPFYGVAHVGYIPNETRLGTPELRRIVEACSRGIQVQHQMTNRIGLWLHHQLAARGVGVLVQAVHICMPPTVVSANGAQTMTTSFYGSLRDNADAQVEFLTLASQEHTSTQEGSYAHE